MAKHYIPGDPSSSPYEPYMGAIVVYRQSRIGRTQRESFPAIIVRKHDDDRCDLTVFTTMGVRHIMNVPFSADDNGDNTWGWLPEPVRRQVQVAETC